MTGKPSRFIKDYSWAQNVENILSKYNDDPNVIEVVITTLNIFVNAEHAIAGKSTTQGTVSLMTDLTTNLGHNPFWQQHGVTIMSDVASRWRDWMRAIMLFKEEGGATGQVAGLRSSFISLADYALLHREGNDRSDYLQTSAKLHKELMAALNEA